MTALSLVRDEDLAEKANSTAAELRAALRQVLIEESVPWGIYGESSAFLIYPNPTGEDVDPATFDPLKLGFAKLKGARSGRSPARSAWRLMSHGVDVMGAPGGFVSATHGGAEIEKTVHALRQTVRALKAEREVKAACRTRPARSVRRRKASDGCSGIMVPTFLLGQVTIVRLTSRAMSKRIESA